MKHYLTFTVLLAAAICFPASAVNHCEKATDVAENFLATKLSKVPENGMVATATIDGSRFVRTATTNQEADFYAYNAESNGQKCFVLMASGNAGEMDVIGYGTNGAFSFDNMPYALREWMQNYAAATATASATTPRAALPPAEPVAPMLSSKWGQGAPYNDACPVNQGNKTLVGCTATAMAQVLYYYKSDRKGEGLIEYVSGGQELSVDFSKASYEWDKMLDSYEEGNYTEEQAEAVAKLMFEAGVACRSEYGRYETSAKMPWEGFCRQYDYVGEHMWRNWVPTDVWMETIQNELKAGRPILYGGNDGSSAHMFVVDGIDADYNVHVNWGWNGLDDGYYDVTFCNAPSQDNDGYYRNHSMLVGLRPRTDADTPYTPTPYVLGYSEKVYYGGFNGAYSRLCGVSSNTYESTAFDIAGCLVQNGEIKYHGNFESQTLRAGSYKEFTAPYISNETIADGIYEFRAAYKTADGEIKLVPMHDYAATIVTVADGEESYEMPFDSGDRITVIDVRPAGELIGKAPLYLDITARNDRYGESGAMAFDLKFVNLEDGKEYVESVVFTSPYSGIEETKRFKLMPVNKENEFRIPGGEYQVLPVDETRVSMEKDIFITIQPEVDYPLFDQTAEMYSDRLAYYQTEAPSFFFNPLYSTANNVSGNIDFNVYACPADGGEPTLLWTVSDVEVPTSSASFQSPVALYPLLGEYYFTIRFITPDGERSILNPDPEREYVNIIKSDDADFPRITTLEPASRETTMRVGEPCPVNIAVRNDGESDFRGTVVAYFYDSETNALICKAETEPASTIVAAGATATATVTPTFPKDGEFTVVAWCRPEYGQTEYAMLTDTEGNPAKFQLRAKQAGVAEIGVPDMRIYPNPASDVATIEGIPSGATVEIYAVSGVKVKEAIADGTSLQISVNDMPEGMYFVRVGGTTLKLLKR